MEGIYCHLGVKMPVINKEKYMAKLAKELLAYIELHNLLDVLTKSHLLSEEANYEGRSYDNNYEGSLHFIDKQLTLYNVSSDSTVGFSSSDSALNYKYLMLRVIVGQKADHSFGDEIELRHDGRTFTRSGLVDSFAYKNATGHPIDAFIEDRKGKISVNHEAFYILRNDVAKVKNIILQTLREHKAECNIIKNTATEDQSEICTNFAGESSNPDYEMSKYTCFETLTLVSNPEFNYKCNVVSEL